MKRKQQEESLRNLILKHVKRSRDLFINSHGLLAEDYEPCKAVKRAVKIRSEYGLAPEQADPLLGTQLVPYKAVPTSKVASLGDKQLDALTLPAPSGPASGVVGGQPAPKPVLPKAGGDSSNQLQILPVPTSVLAAQQKIRHTAPQWHPPWKLHKVLAGHVGWVRTVCVDWTNEWFATGGDDRVIKIWELASGKLKVSFTGHISCVKQLAISKSSPYLFSVGEDKMVKCWDLEVNKCIRQYHGHLSGVYCCTLHPTLDLLITGGRDATVRVWDIRTKKEAVVLGGHSHTVHTVAAQSAQPQIISGSQDSTVRLWDLVKGSSMKTLTNHKKGIRALVVHPVEYTFASGGADNIKKWKCPDGEFMQNFTGHNTVIHSLAVNQDNVLVSGGDNGSIKLWDWQTCHCFQTIDTVAQPGSLESESAIFAVTFDKSGTRMLTGEADKTIKIWKEDEDASPESHPVRFKPEVLKSF
eukprot:RCo036542